jgi:hypothetical protein
MDDFKGIMHIYLGKSRKPGQLHENLRFSKSFQTGQSTLNSMKGVIRFSVFSKTFHPAAGQKSIKMLGWV